MIYHSIDCFFSFKTASRHVMPSTDRKLELKAKTSMAQTVSQPAVYAKGLMKSRNFVLPLIPPWQPHKIWVGAASVLSVWFQNFNT
jgi:hypothetical protein